MLSTRTFALTMTLVLTSCAFAQDHPVMPRDAATAAAMVAPEVSPSYRLRAGDQVSISFALSRDFDQSVYVLPDGFMSLREAGTILAEGLTTPELTQRIKQAYTGILHQPVITVTLRDFEKPYFIANGQVGKPGKYDLRGRVTVSEAVAIAGGLTTASKHSQVILFRRSANGLTEAHAIDLKHQLAKHDLSEDTVLREGDMVYVPQNRMSKLSRYLPSSSLGVFANPYAF